MESGKQLKYVLKRPTIEQLHSKTGNGLVKDSINLREQDKLWRITKNNSVDNFQILLCNCRSLCSKIEDARATCAALHPDLFACTETWLRCDISDDILSICNYSLFRSDRPIKSGGGVAIYLSENIKAIILSPTIVVSPTSIESVWLHLQSLNILFLCIYIPPGLPAKEHCEISNFLQTNIDSYLCTLKEPKVFISGDFNDFSTEIICSMFYLYNTVNEPTRNYSFLDKILIPKSLTYKTEIGPPLSNSDHNSVLTAVDLRLSSLPLGSKIVYDLRQRFVSNLVTCIRTYDWDILVNSDLDVNEKCSIFNDFIAESFSNSFLSVPSLFHQNISLGSLHT